MNAPAPTDPVSVTMRDDGVLVVRLTNEQTRNSMTHEMRSQLGAAMSAAGRDANVRAVYLTGQGKSFCSGGDLRMLEKESDPWAVHRRFRTLGAWFLSFMQMEKPLVVGVNGHAVGGGMGLAFAGDIIVAAESASFISGFFRLGVVPDVGMMYMLPRLIGMARAKRFLFGNETLTARQAMEWGLVTDVVADDDLERAGLERAITIANGPATVMGLSKMIMARSFETSLNDMFLMEGFGQAMAMSSPDFAEGLSALTQRRPPVFNRADGGEPEAEG